MGLETVGICCFSNNLGNHLETWAEYLRALYRNLLLHPVSICFVTISNLSAAAYGSGDQLQRLQQRFFYSSHPIGECTPSPETKHWHIRKMGLVF